MTDFTVDEPPVPASIDGPGAADFIAAINVGNTVEAIGYGTTDLQYAPDEELPHFHNPHEPRRMLVARVEGRVVARALYETHTGEGADAAWLGVQVLPEFRGRGIGTRLADEVEGITRAEGKTKAIVFTPIPDGPGPRREAPTGFGSIVADDPAVRFLLGRGYRFEQIERVSRLALPVPGLEALVADARRASGPEYALHTWVGATPERWQRDIALLNTRMSTDAPTAGLEAPEDVWTVERLIAADTLAQQNPRRRLSAAVEHLPTGTLAGFTELFAPPQLHRAADQWSTLVLPEHRGHRLGMLLKVANLQHLERAAAGHPSIITFNAEENRPMLDVNEAVGFVPIASESGWRKDLD